MSVLTADAGPFYLIVGSFTEQGDARRLAESIRYRHKEASFKFDRERALFHVYAASTNAYAKAQEFRSMLQLTDGFSNAWIYADLEQFGSASEVVDCAPSEYARIEMAGSAAASLDINQANSKISGHTSRASAHAMTFAIEAQTTTGLSIPGQVKLLTTQGNALVSFKTGNTIRLNLQGGRRLIIACEVRGYGPEVAFIDLNNTSATKNLRKSADGVWQLVFKLGKIDPNTVKLVYREMFQSDAAIFHSDARPKLNLLSEMIKVNPYLQIEINAHCPETGRRPLKVPVGERASFDASITVSRVGNEKFLSAARAKAIKGFLVKTGVPNRISTIGWGHLAPLCPIDSPNPELDERVEVELKRLK